MSVTKDDVMKVSHLAKIKLEGSEKVDELCNALNRILGFVEQLNEVDCSGIDDDAEYEAVLHEREDIIEQFDPAVMNSTSCIESNMFVVPKVIK
jgi:aspartyl-tRNA(Asn)/glutamyl-tRNA(Gln) amidotransferase subunit C